MLPVIHPGAFQGAVVQLEPERLDQVQPCGAGGGAKTGDIARVRRDLGLDQDDVEVGTGHEWMGQARRLSFCWFLHTSSELGR